MAKAIAQIHVEDYERWYPAFIEFGEVRRGHGATGHVIYRSVDDPNTVVVVNDFATADGARAFMEDPSLKDAMARGGVDSVPQFWLCDEADSQRY
jgi:voltage-gated potassium channel Kch